MNLYLHLTIKIINTMFGFALDTDNEPEIITLISDVKNIEGPSPIIYKKIRLISVNDISSLKSAIKNSSKTYENNGFIYLIDQQKNILSGTFISNIKIIKSRKNNIILSGFVWCHPKGYQKAWNMKFNDEIKEKNSWKNFEKNELQGWLVYTLRSGKFDSAQENINIQIDGNEFHNIDSFFCKLGEEINGTAGYFGRNFGALSDCLQGGFGVKSITELTWNNHQKSKKLFKTKFKTILNIFEEFNVKVSLK
ncbi:barstar family protein [Chryseobacterium sp. WG14]|uniref:barstar family protein n=1 Tax=Chryseobacterium sp. WG14 TaxID=2926909 RepID=UPI00211E71E4|nr:barstar family protein [Chryseobacterium sp. WG14]MCQ9641658.1 barstar family protein [Chryseobacterium sp. WG14]